MIPFRINQILTAESTRISIVNKMKNNGPNENLLNIGKYLPLLTAQAVVVITMILAIPPKKIAPLPLSEETGKNHFPRHE